MFRKEWYELIIDHQKLFQKYILSYRKGETEWTKIYSNLQKKLYTQNQERKSKCITHKKYFKCSSNKAPRSDRVSHFLPQVSSPLTANPRQEKVRGDPQLRESSHCPLAEQGLQTEVIFSYKELQNA